MPGEPALRSRPTAFTNARRPSASTTRDAGPGENPSGCECKSTIADRTRSGTASPREQTSARAAGPSTGIQGSAYSNV